MAMATMDEILSAIDAGQTAAVERLFGFLRIPSVSAVPAHFPDCDRAADWLVAELGSLGFDAAKHPTDGRPMVLGHLKCARRDAPHVLFYGHYDVQPADPLELWRSPPFEPTLESGPRGERIVARGAVDDKGQLMTFLEACRAFQQFGGPPCSITALFEGEEETGSPSLPAFLAKNAKALKADVALVCDTGMWGPTVPAITIALRGIVGEEVVLTGPNRDLHSGVFGGLAVNPINVLAGILGGLHDANGAVALPGFYDGVEELPKELLELWDGLDFDAAAFLGGVGLTTPAGERGRTPLEQLWSRPSCDINGISGGYAGEGQKTVIASTASAKVTFRLVGKQNPERVSQSFRAFVASRLPPDVKARFIGGGGSPALSLSIKNEALRRAKRALEAEWGKPAALVGCGGSIPIVGAFKRELNMDCLLVGFGLDDDNMHSPNEKYERTSFHKGARSWARILAALAA
ncbi:acetylornithine deacetylase/succinyl-diaminopimelate desuccinylase-like protein [Roseiarcus fermentans]|uniref:Acetylornithine deacetylase/succinyl-diaminopimelate desuccinylase-like protein n=2 Tax=Roseiarcus fermentans TaxID=1473586 RepID=A0A366EMD5_9HYPH|nr:acetylornithine deacetylase/succinyl-diaminopimelate desuccinylase-like protein [Roseiarcus fermentans]